MADPLYQVFFKAKLWQVKEQSARCAAGKFAEKDAALVCARQLASAVPGKIVVLAADGSLEQELGVAKPKPALKAPKVMVAGAAEAPKKSSCAPRKKA